MKQNYPYSMIAFSATGRKDLSTVSKNMHFIQSFVDEMDRLVGLNP